MIGHTLNGTYRISELVGGGGFADVYLGRDLRTNTVVAIKVLHAHYARDPQIVQRFLQEARTAQALVEPHIVRVLDAGQDSGSYYIVMEYVQGHTLAHLVQTRGALPIQEAVEYTRQILQALEAAHRAGTVHRDIKPQNVMVTPDGTVKVMDFGIAKHAAAGKMTQTGMYLGTPQYMSPEQARGERVDRRSDLYSVAIVLYEMLGGRPPFDGESPWQVLNQQAQAEVPPIGRLRSEVPLALQHVLARGLQKAPERRFQNAEEMLAALPQAAPDKVADQGTSTRVYPAARLPGRPRPVMLAPMLAVGLTVLLIVLWAIVNPPPPPPTPTAPSQTPSTSAGASAATPSAYTAEPTAAPAQPTAAPPPADSRVVIVPTPAPTMTPLTPLPGYGAAVLIVRDKDGRPCQGQEVQLTENRAAQKYAAILDNAGQTSILNVVPGGYTWTKTGCVVVDSSYSNPNPSVNTQIIANQVTTTKLEWDPRPVAVLTIQLRPPSGFPKGSTSLVLDVVRPGVGGYGFYFLQIPSDGSIRIGQRPDRTVRFIGFRDPQGATISARFTPASFGPLRAGVAETVTVYWSPAASTSGAALLPGVPSRDQMAKLGGVLGLGLVLGAALVVAERPGQAVRRRRQR